MLQGSREYRRVFGVRFRTAASAAGSSFRPFQSSGMWKSRGPRAPANRTMNRRGDRKDRRSGGPGNVHEEQGTVVSAPGILSVWESNGGLSRMLGREDSKEYPASASIWFRPALD